MRHYAPTYRLAIFRPNGVPFASVGGLPTTPLALEQRANHERGVIRARLGWTPTFRVYLVDQTGSADVTHLFRLG